ncbi:MAG TPA: DUF3761 domain-containing protein [Steroidobacteraceae bacterium]|nr:DUF3761 domain-containing protein [Steroidobacteraceae bacterium]
MIPSRIFQTASLATGMLLVAVAFSQVPAGAPAGTTGQCKDGSYTSAASKRGACSGHKGVETWYASSTSASSGGAAPAAPTASAPPAPAAPASAPAPAAAPSKSSSNMPAATAAPGGGPGLVWVNKTSHVYHCQGDRWYGKTKNGAYMSESAAKAEGDRADHNKPCS